VLSGIERASAARTSGEASRGTTSDADLLAGLFILGSSDLPSHRLNVATEVRSDVTFILFDEAQIRCGLDAH